MKVMHRKGRRNYGLMFSVVTAVALCRNSVAQTYFDRDRSNQLRVGYFDSMCLLTWDRVLKTDKLHPNLCRLMSKGAFQKASPIAESMFRRNPNDLVALQAALTCKLHLGGLPEFVSNITESAWRKLENGKFPKWLTLFWDLARFAAESYRVNGKAVVSLSPRLAHGFAFQGNYESLPDYQATTEIGALLKCEALANDDIVGRKVAKSYLKKFPKSVPLRLLISNCYLIRVGRYITSGNGSRQEVPFDDQQWHFDLVASFVEEAVELDPAYALSHFFLGRALRFDAKNQARVQKHLKMYLESSPFDVIRAAHCRKLLADNDQRKPTISANH